MSGFCDTCAKGLLIPAAAWAVFVLLGCGAQPASPVHTAFDHTPSSGQQAAALPQRTGASRSSPEQVAIRDQEIHQLGEAFFGGLVAQDLQNLQRHFLTDETVISKLNFLSSGNDYQKQMFSEFTQRVGTLRDDVETAFNRTAKAARRGDLDWNDVKLVNVIASDKRFDKHLELYCFDHMLIEFVDPATPDRRYAVEIGAGLKVDDQWYFVDDWEGLIRTR